MFRHAARASVVLLALVLLAPAVASAQQSISFNVGYFAVKGEDSRADGDVLFANRSFHTFDLDELSNASFGAEWLFPLGDYLEGGVGAGFYRRTIPSVYTEFVNANGAEIEQDFKLRVIPLSATLRFLPLGRHASVQPYVGAGLGVFAWRYSESGEFVDADFNVFRNRFVETGTATGPLVFGGVRIPVANSFAIGGEVRWQRAEGEFETPDDFNGDRIDLGGITYQAVLQFRF